jgi:phospholipid/cholesterol/gamma-HCH transport system ATP-binding protein
MVVRCEMGMVVNEDVLKICGLEKSFGDARILGGLSLTLQKGERLSILGPGGSGKSTLLKIVMGLIRSDKGSIELLGKDLTLVDRATRSSLLRRVAMAFQLGGLFDFMNVRQNIKFAMENMTDLPPSVMDERVVELLNAVNLPHAASKFPSELSGGMRRRVGIVRAMSTSPELGLFDEPTAGLDPVTSSMVIDMIHRIAEKIGTSCLCVTSSVEVAFTFAKRVAVLRDGQILATGTWDELQAENDPWLRHFLSVRHFSPSQP